MKSAIILSAISAIASVAAWGIADDPALGLGCHGPCSVKQVAVGGEDDWVKIDCENCNYINEDDETADEYTARRDGYLNDCFVNKHGKLENKDGGRWNRSCKEISVTDDGILTAKCADGQGGWSESSIDIKKSGLIAADFGLGCEGA